jgi:pimeloyl-ACP methyl ester carboxylesterase
LVIKVTKLILLSLFALLITIILGTWIYHTNITKKEVEDTPPMGQYVEVNGHLMHLYFEGDGEDLIVFMSGAGTSSPTLDFKPLWTALLPEYRISVVEKAGYGWSDVADVSRDIDFMLEETRSALKGAGESPPYILAAHSMSGLEAIRWAQKYPEEVKAIIGLDPTVPEVYDVLQIPGGFIQSIARIGSYTGLLRLVPAIANSSAAIASGNLSAADEDTYRALFYRRTLSANMREETKVVRENAVIVGSDPVPIHTPMYFFISDGKEMGVSNWQSILSNYTDQLTIGKYLFMDSGHYLHTYEPDEIAEEINTFIQSIK